MIARAEPLQLQDGQRVDELEDGRFGQGHAEGDVDVRTVLIGKMVQDRHEDARVGEDDRGGGPAVSL